MEKRTKKIFVAIALILIGAIVVPLICIAFLVTAFAVFPMVAMNVYVWLQPDPPKPGTTYGEFPFELVYEIDGEVITVEDTYVCEYDGWTTDSANLSKQREWKEVI